MLIGKIVSSSRICTPPTSQSFATTRPAFTIPKRRNISSMAVRINAGLSRWATSWRRWSGLCARNRIMKPSMDAIVSRPPRSSNVMYDMASKSPILCPATVALTTLLPRSSPGFARLSMAIPEIYSMRAICAVCRSSIEPLLMKRSTIGTSFSLSERGRATRSRKTYIGMILPNSDMNSHSPRSRKPSIRVTTSSVTTGSMPSTILGKSPRLSGFRMSVCTGASASSGSVGGALSSRGRKTRRLEKVSPSRRIASMWSARVATQWPPLRGVQKMSGPDRWNAA